MYFEDFEGLMNELKKTVSDLQNTVPADKDEYTEDSVVFGSTDESHTVSITMPSEDVKDTTVEVIDDKLVVTITKVTEDAEDTWVFKFDVPENPDPSVAKATYTNGQLTIAIPKLATNKKIEITQVPA